MNGSDHINHCSREKDEEALGSHGAQNMNRNTRENTGIFAARSTRSWPPRPIGRAVPVTRVVTATEFWTEYMRPWPNCYPFGQKEHRFSVFCLLLSPLPYCLSVLRIVAVGIKPKAMAEASFYFELTLRCTLNEIENPTVSIVHLSQHFGE